MISALSAQIMLARYARQGHSPAHPVDPSCSRNEHLLLTTSSAETPDQPCSFAFVVTNAVCSGGNAQKLQACGTQYRSQTIRQLYGRACYRSLHIPWPRLLSVSDEPACEQTTDLSCTLHSCTCTYLDVGDCSTHLQQCFVVETLHCCNWWIVTRRLEFSLPAGRCDHSFCGLASKLCLVKRFTGQPDKSSLCFRARHLGVQPAGFPSQVVSGYLTSRSDEVLSFIGLLSVSTRLGQSDSRILTLCY